MEKRKDDRMATARQQSRASGKTYAPVSAVARSMAILDYLAARPLGSTVSELSVDLGIEISVVFRLLASLEVSEYVHRSATSDRYLLGFKLAGIAYRQLNTLGLPEICQPELDRLARDVRELVHLSLVDGQRVRMIAKAEGDQRITLRGLVGLTAAPDTMATGKAWLAWLDDEERLAVLSAPREDPFDRPRPSLEALLQELDSVRERGYALDHRSEDVSAVAVPVWAGDPAEVVAVVTVSGPSFRLTEAALAEIAGRTLETAATLGDLWPAVFLHRQLHPDR